LKFVVKIYVIFYKNEFRKCYWQLRYGYTAVTNITNKDYYEKLSGGIRYWDGVAVFDCESYGTNTTDPNMIIISS